MLSYLRLLLPTLLVVLSTTTAQAIGENVNEQLRNFALDRVKDGQRLITGPSEISLPTIDPHTSCVDLYHRRTALRRRLHDYNPPYWDDPRNQAAIFLGAIWTPVFISSATARSPRTSIKLAISTQWQNSRH
jgi:hypothetical protein